MSRVKKSIMQSLSDYVRSMSDLQLASGANERDIEYNKAVEEHNMKDTKIEEKKNFKFDPKEIEHNTIGSDSLKDYELEEIIEDEMSKRNKFIQGLQVEPEKIKQEKNNDGDERKEEPVNGIMQTGTDEKEI